MRSQPKNITKQFISLIIGIVDPPKPMGRHPVMSVDLEKALSAIQKGAEEQLEVLKSKKKQIEEGKSSVEMVPKLIGHIEKMEEEEVEDEQRDETEGGAVAVAKGDDTGGAKTGEAGEEGEVMKETDKGQHRDETTTDDPKKKPRVTKSITKMKEQRKQAKIKEQERRWREVMAKGLGEALMGEVDLEEAMMSPEEEGEQEKTSEYSKIYTKTHKK